MAIQNRKFFDLVPVCLQTGIFLCPGIPRPSVSVPGSAGGEVYGSPDPVRLLRATQANGWGWVLSSLTHRFVCGRINRYIDFFMFPPFGDERGLFCARGSSSQLMREW